MAIAAVEGLEAWFMAPGAPCVQLLTSVSQKPLHLPKLKSRFESGFFSPIDFEIPETASHTVIANDGQVLSKHRNCSGRCAPISCFL
jgi:hypothetical protein